MSNSKIAILISLLLVSCVIQARTTVAVQDFTAENCEAYIGAVSSREFRNVLVGNKELTVLDRSSMEMILKEQDFQFSGCTSAECAIEMGKLLAANFIVTGTVSKMGNAYYISINCIGVETGEIKYSKSNYIEGGVELVMPLSHNLAAEFSNQYFGTHFPMRALSRQIAAPTPANNNLQLNRQPQLPLMKKGNIYSLRGKELKWKELKKVLSENPSSAPYYLKLDKLNKALMPMGIITIACEIISLPSGIVWLLSSPDDLGDSWISEDARAVWGKVALITGIPFAAGLIVLLVTAAPSKKLMEDAVRAFNSAQASNLKLKGFFTLNENGPRGGLRLVF